jgi:tRNA pseudouridine38-40 synthase
VPHYRIQLEYDGTEFHGWQIQPGQRTVQGELVAVLSRFDGAPVHVVGAGRTDAGVHALGQVASFTLRRDWDPERLRRALDADLPPDMRVPSAAIVPPEFSARASATWRHYRYQMLRRPSALGRRTHYVLPYAVDAGAMREAAAQLLGEHDFTAFARAHPDVDPHCTVLETQVTATAERVDFEIRAQRFLHNMVRRLSGVLVEVGRGRLRPQDVTDILVTRDVQRGGPCLPAQGLFLIAVGYPVGVDGILSSP